MAYSFTSFEIGGMLNVNLNLARRCEAMSEYFRPQEIETRAKYAFVG
jgi:hypothetical protein